MFIFILHLHVKLLNGILMLGFFIPMLCDESIVNRMHALFVCLLCMLSIARSCDVQDTCLKSMNNFSKALVFTKCHFPCQGDPCLQRLQLESSRRGGHPDRSWDVQDTCDHSMINFCQELVSQFSWSR